MQCPATGTWALAVERFIIEGDLAADSFLPWIVRHMQRLGLRGAPVRRSDGQVEITLRGPEELIDAMELGVSLGPIDVWVEAIARQRLQNDAAPDRPQSQTGYLLSGPD
jgi:acylphosphatase